MANRETLADRLYEMEPDQRLLSIPYLDGAERDVLRQVSRKVVWDGNVCSKAGRTGLVQKGLCERWNGFNFATRSGIAVAETLGMMEEIRG